MQRHLAIVASAFQLVGLLLGVPSLIASLWLSWQALQLHRLTPESNEVASARDSTPSLIGFMVEGARLFGKLFSVFGGATQVVFTIAAVAAFVALLLSVLLFFIGRGLHAHEPWARLVGAAVLFLMLFVSGLGALSVRRGLAGFILSAAAAAGIYGLWTLLAPRAPGTP